MRFRNPARDHIPVNRLASAEYVSAIATPVFDRVYYYVNTAAARGAGTPVPSGVYYYRFKAGSISQVGTLVLLRR